jgi:hypothetical protein
MAYTETDVNGDVHKGLGRLGNVQTISGATTLTKNESGAIYEVDTDAVITLPPVVSGCEFTFQDVGADTAVEITLSPDAADGIIGTIANAAADSVASGVVDKDFVNTKATTVKGDYIKIRGGVDGWYIVGGVGIWASEG